MAELKCWFLWIFILCRVFSSVANEPKQLKFNIIREGSEFKCVEEPLYIVIGDTFQVNVNNGEHPVQTSNRCTTSLNDFRPISTTFLNRQSGVFVSKPHYNAINTGTFHFECVFYKTSCKYSETSGNCNYKDSGGHDRWSDSVTCSVEVLVNMRGVNVERPQGYLTVNGANYSSPIDRNLYSYNNGQGANITCHKTSGTFVKLVYTRFQKVFETEYEERDSVSMYMKLRDATHDVTLECITADKTDKRKHVIKLTLKKYTTPQQGLLAFLVNGFYVPITKLNGIDKYFEYKFYDEEQIIGALVKDNSYYGTPTCNLKDTSLSGTSFSFNLSKDQSGISLTCTVPQTHNSQGYHMELTFVLYNPEFNPYITGLAMSNILMQYSGKAGNQIQYEMGGQNSLTVNCKSFDSEKKTSWRIPSELSAPQSENTELKIYNTNSNQIVECRIDNGEKSTILEIRNTKVDVATPGYPETEVPQGTTRPTITTTEAPILRDSTPTEETITPAPTDGLGKASETNTAAPDHIIAQTAGPPEPQGSSSMEKGTISAVVGCLLFVIVLGVFVICVIFKKRKQIRTNPSNMEYQNLPAHNEGPMATPPQWDQTDPYIGISSLDNLYAKPLPKCKRNQQPTYAVPHESTYRNNLAVVDYSEPTYASVQGTGQSYEPEDSYQPGTAYENFSTNERETYQNLSTRKKGLKTQAKKSHKNLSIDEPQTYQNISTRDKPQNKTIDDKNVITNEPTPSQNLDAMKTKKDSLKKTNKHIGSPSNERVTNEYQNQTELLNNKDYINVGDSKYVNANADHAEVEPDYCQLINK